MAITPNYHPPQSRLSAMSAAAAASSTTKQQTSRGDGLGRRFKRSISSLSQFSTGTSTVVTQDQSDLGFAAFSYLATPSAVLTLEDYDEALANLTKSSSSSSPNHRAITNDNGSKEDGDATVVAVNRNELHRISLLGRGCYSNVYLVTDRHKNKLAMKCLDASRIADPDELVIAATDLAMEAMILKQLQPHDHIIRLHGVSSATFSHSFAEAGDGGEGYFLLLGVLTETLSDRLERWRRDKRSVMADPSATSSSSGSNSPKRGALSRMRLSHLLLHQPPMQIDVPKMYGRIETVAMGIIRGMMYVHSHGIVLRDMKPSNCGFDEDGQVRLFDFGMARRVEDCHADEICGSPRYMAPEVMAGTGYTLKADVYSFGVVLFELCSLEIPFTDMNNTVVQKKKAFKNPSTVTAGSSSNILEDFQRLVVEQNLRPRHLERIPCAKTRALIQDCWESNPEARPSFEEIFKRLTDILESSGN